MLSSTLLLKVIMEAFLADYLTEFWEYFSKTPNLGGEVRQISGISLGMPHLGFIKG